MKLFYSQTSPYARKVNMLLQLSSVVNDYELVLSNFESPDLRAKNPLGKIPALVDGELSLFESTLICEYLDDKHVAGGGRSFFRKDEAGYYLRQREHMRANGILDAAVPTVMESRRTTEHSQHWLGRWKLAIDSALKTVELEHLGSAEDPHIATVAMVAALGYLDFRLSHYQWRNCNAALADWYKSLEDQDWLVNTAPPL